MDQQQVIGTLSYSFGGNADRECGRRRWRGNREPDEHSILFHPDWDGRRFSVSFRLNGGVCNLRRPDDESATMGRRADRMFNPMLLVVYTRCDDLTGSAGRLEMARKTILRVRSGDPA